MAAWLRRALHFPPPGAAPGRYQNRTGTAPTRVVPWLLAATGGRHSVVLVQPSRAHAVSALAARFGAHLFTCFVSPLVRQIDKRLSIFVICCRCFLFPGAIVCLFVCFLHRENRTKRIGSDRIGSAAWSRIVRRRFVPCKCQPLTRL